MPTLETMEKWEELLIRYSESELLLGMFCTVEGVSAASFSLWRKKLLPNYRGMIEDFWREHDVKQKASGIGFNEYCRRNKLGRCSFRSFLKKEAKRIAEGRPITVELPDSNLPRLPQIPNEVVAKLIHKFLPREGPRPKTVKLWYQRLIAFYESGLSIDEFASQVGVARSVFSEWVTRLSNYFVDGKPQPIDFENVEYGKVFSISEQRDHWQEVMNDFVHSGLSATAFCKQKQIKEHSFFQWKRRLFESNLANGNDAEAASLGRLPSGRNTLIKWLKIMRQFDQSNLSGRQFIAQTEGVRPSSFHVWKRKLAPYIVRNEHDEYLEIDMLTPKLPEDDSFEKLNKLWSEQRKNAPNSSKSVFSYYFWAEELGLEIDRSPTDTTSCRNEIGAAEEAGKCTPRLAKSPSQAAEEHVNPMRPPVVQEKQYAIKTENPPTCVTVKMPDGASIALPKNTFAIEAVVKRLIDNAA